MRNKTTCILLVSVINKPEPGGGTLQQVAFAAEVVRLAVIPPAPLAAVNNCGVAAAAAYWIQQRLGRKQVEARSALVLEGIWSQPNTHAWEKLRRGCLQHLVATVHLYLRQPYI
jgi:hypothetical protein